VDGHAHRARETTETLDSLPMSHYTGKVVVVTGASQGIGRALCLALAEQRPRLVLAARDEAKLQEVAEECRKKGADVLVVPTDVSSPVACEALVKKTLERFVVLDVLVNNAGIGMIARFDEVQDLGVFEQLMKVNYLGCVYPTYFALPALKQARGQIVAVASLAGLTGVPTRTGYAASKHAVFGFFDSLRIELRANAVDVTVVAPDFVVSEIHRRATGADGRPLGASPMQESRIMTAEECAALIVSAMTRRKRLAVLSLRGRVGRYVQVVAPGLIDWIAERAVKAGK
jgi:short-subunit dehydrogenase